MENKILQGIQFAFKSTTDVINNECLTENSYSSNVREYCPNSRKLRVRFLHSGTFLTCRFAVKHSLITNTQHSLITNTSLAQKQAKNQAQPIDLEALLDNNTKVKSNRYK